MISFAVDPRYIQDLEDDIGLTKRIIETILCNDPDIIELIDDPNLDPASPDEYVYTHLFPFIRIPGTQDESKNFICYASPRFPYIFS